MEAAVSVPAARAESTPCVVFLSFMPVFLEVVSIFVKIAQYTPIVGQNRPHQGKFYAFLFFPRIDPYHTFGITISIIEVSGSRRFMNSTYP